ncbi:MAG: hypothetical protein AB7P20_16900 [Rhizobiaceae bacterium]
MIDRRGLLAAFALTPLASTFVRAEDAAIYRVGGTVTTKNFPGFAAFMMNSVDEFVGLKLIVPAMNTGEGSLSSEETDGSLSIWQQGGDVNLHFSSGYRKQGDAYYFDGFYQVKYGGMHQGINGLGLMPARTMDVEAANKPVKDIDIGRLPADLKG